MGRFLEGEMKHLAWTIFGLVVCFDLGFMLGAMWQSLHHVCAPITPYKLEPKPACETAKWIMQNSGRTL